MVKDHTNDETRVKLLKAGLDLFADGGYRGATLRAICRKAGVNIAAVNYHFGDKDQLYRTVIEQAVATFEEGMWPFRPDASPASPQQRLRRYVFELLKNLLGADRPALALRLMCREFIEPTPSLDVMIVKLIEPFKVALSAIVGDLLGEIASARPELVRDCVVSVNSLCVFYYHCEVVVERVDERRLHDRETIEQLTEHIVQFALGGIEFLKNREKKGLNQRDTQANGANRDRSVPAAR